MHRPRGRAVPTPSEERSPDRARAGETVVDGVEPLAWLDAQRVWPKVFFGDLARGEFLAGAGAVEVVGADEPRAAAELERTLAAAVAAGSADAPGWIGGMRFAPERRASEAWAPFGAAWWVLPRRYLRSDGAHTFEGELAGDGGAPTCPAPPASAPGEDPDAYLERVAAALAAIEADELEKVVLARTVARKGRVDPAATLAKLSAAEPRGYAFWLAPAPGYGFFGVTPETLYRRRGTAVEADALAGTTPRDADPARDRALAEALLADPKSRHEHEVVRAAIVASLEPVATRVEAPATPALLGLARVHHLHTPVRAELREPGSLLARLHPTPAVCGTPRDRAQAAIERLERVDRGLYSGAVGWWRADGEDVAVALRCAQYAADTTTTYLGAGVVAGSSPAAEHAELEDKAAALWAAWTEVREP